MPQTSFSDIAVKSRLDETLLQGDGAPPVRERSRLFAIPPSWRSGAAANVAAAVGSRRGRLCLLRADGRIVGSDGEEKDPAGAYLLVLARELCRFHLFPSLAGVPRSRTEAAAEIYCETQSPFETSDSLKLRTSRGVAIWSWDRARVKALIGDRSPYYRDRILPEPLVHPAGDGWCQREDVNGFEAQYWEEGILLASMWRRRPFDREQWSQFTSEITAPAVPAPPLPPEPERLALPFSITATPPRVRPRWGWTELERGALALALAAILYGSYNYGQTTEYERLAAADSAELETVMAEGGADPLIQGALSDLALTRAFAGMSGGNAPLAAAAEAFGLLSRYGFTVSEWRVDDLAFQARVSPVPDLALVHDVASVMESHPFFVNVTSRTDKAGDMLILEAELERPGRPAPLAKTTT